MKRRLIRNIEGERPPLIMHRRMYRVRALDQRLRFVACKALGLKYRRPRYMNSQRTPEQEADLALACESFIGVRSPDPRVARYYFEVGRWILLADPSISDERKRSLLAEGPRCSRDDMVYVSGLPVAGRDTPAADAATAALVRLLVQVRDAAGRLSAEGTQTAFPDPAVVRRLR